MELRQASYLTNLPPQGSGGVYSNHIFLHAAPNPGFNGQLGALYDDCVGREALEWRARLGTK